MLSYYRALQGVFVYALTECISYRHVDCTCCAGLVAGVPMLSVSAVRPVFHMLPVPAAYTCYGGCPVDVFILGI